MSTGRIIGAWMMSALMGSTSVLALFANPGIAVAQTVTLTDNQPCVYESTGTAFNAGGDRNAANNELRNRYIAAGVDPSSIPNNGQAGEDFGEFGQGDATQLTAPAIITTTITPAGGSSTTPSSGPPSISTSQISNTEVLDGVRRRREQQVAQASPAPESGGAGPQQTTAQPSSVQPQTQTSGAAPVAQPLPPQAQSIQPAPPSSAASTRNRAAQRHAAAASQTAAPMPGTVAADTSLSSSDRLGAWAQAFGEYERHTDLAPGTTRNTTRRQWTAGGATGLDRTMILSPYASAIETLTIGFLAGGIHTKNRFSDTATVLDSTSTQSGGFVGLYSAYAYGRLSFDMIVKTDLLKHRQKSTSVVTGAGNRNVTTACPENVNGLMTLPPMGTHS